MDDATENDGLRVRFALVRLQKEALELGDSAFVSSVRIETAVFVVFDSLESWEEHQMQLLGEILEADLPYLRLRAQTTNASMRARYLHAIASVTRRRDDGRTAAKAYLEAISFYRTHSEDKQIAFMALFRLFPLAAIVCRRNGMGTQYKTEAIDFIKEPTRGFAAAKALVFVGLLENKKTLSIPELEQLREVSATLPGELSSNDAKLLERISIASQRLLSRLGSSPDDALRAEAAALEQKIVRTPSPMLIEITGTRLLYLYGRLKDDVARRAIVAKMHEARGQQNVHTFSGSPDGWSEEMIQLRIRAVQIVREMGPITLLATIGAAKQFVPSIATVQAQVEDLQAQGAGVARQLAEIIVSADKRIVGYESTEFDEQYGIYWQVCSVAPTATMLGEAIVRGDLKVSHVKALLDNSWIGQEEDIAYGGGAKMPNDLVRLFLAPIQLYFNAQTGDMSGDMLIPALDSIVLRLEGALRKFARLLGQPDTETNAAGVTKYHGLKTLFNDAVVCEALGADLVQLLKFTLMRKPEGLRDKIGHAILHVGHYRVIDLDACVLCLLRLAAVDLPAASEAVVDDEISDGEPA